jgi:excisionase family DNA binding protein
MEERSKPRAPAGKSLGAALKSASTEATAQQHETTSLRNAPLSDLPLAVAPKAAARLASVGRSTLYVALANGNLKSSKIGKRRLILTDELRRWIASHEVQHTSEVGSGRR